MRALVLVFFCLACIGESRKDHPQGNRDDLATLLFALQPLPSNARVTSNRLGAATMRRGSVVKQEEAGDNTAIGAAAAGGLLGVFFQQDILTVGLLALAAAYASTLSNDVGNAARKVGGFATKAYDKGKNINEEFDILPKVKSTVDTVLSVADNLNENYGITDKIDEKLLLSDKIEKAKDKIGDVTSKVTSSVDELKKAADSK